MKMKRVYATIPDRDATIFKTRLATYGESMNSVIESAVKQYLINRPDKGRKTLVDD